MNKPFSNSLGISRTSVEIKFSLVFEKCAVTPQRFVVKKTSALKARPHLLFQKKLDSWSWALNVNVLFLSNCDKYLNHKHFIPQFFLCWKRDRTNSRKRVVTNYFDKMRTAISGEYTLYFLKECVLCEYWDEILKRILLCVLKISI